MVKALRFNYNIDRLKRLICTMTGTGEILGVAPNLDYIQDQLSRKQPYFKVLSQNEQLI